MNMYFNYQKSVETIRNQKIINVNIPFLNHSLNKKNHGVL